jgi:tetratricopeptide (TPR) repeat protein
MLNDEPTRASKISLPPVPSDQSQEAVAVWSEPVNIDTYLPEQPDHFPAFLETRVYQGSSGRVFPLPFHERISHAKKPHRWEAVHLENEWVRLVILPELGGRIHIAYDKVADYDIFYRNNVIKPALVGLAGPWISGGVEFNWPQHHRPATFLPTDVSIEREADGSVTVWCSDHDPFARMKGMHGIRLRPNSSRIEARVRLYNRSETRQTFLWWANVAAAVNDNYQSFFPTDVHHVADHAKRDVVSFPEPNTPYYGIDYPNRATPEVPDAGRLDWYRNIPVPTSYMVTATDDEFFGGYDHGREAGFVHWASHDISPGKKQWTWGNAPFGWAWDDNLTDGDGPYVELMAGVFTDNQPDFAYLAPGETKTFSQFWYPIQKIGPAQQASARLAARLDLTGGDTALISLVASEVLPKSRIRLSDKDGVVLVETVADLRPSTAYSHSVNGIGGREAHNLRLEVFADDELLLRLAPRAGNEPDTEVASAVEPPAPQDVPNIDELVQIASYLEQYRHATRSPEVYWNEVLARDSGESRATAAIGARFYDRADYAAAADMLGRSIARRTRWAPTPFDGSAHYRLGLALARLGDDHRATNVLARAAWDASVAVPSHYALARQHAKMGRRSAAIELARTVVRADPQHLQAADLLAALLRSGSPDETAEAHELLETTLQRDPLDQWALHLLGRSTTRDATIALDVALEYAGAGLVAEALDALDDAERLLPRLALGQVQVGPLIAYHRAALLWRAGRDDEASAAAQLAALTPWTLCLPSRLDDIDALRTTLDHQPGDPLAAALLGHWYYDRRRYTDAIDQWTIALQGSPDTNLAAVVHRNLGIAFYNVLRQPSVARVEYERALQLTPGDAKLWFEFDQLVSRMGEVSAERLARLEQRARIALERDDLTVEYANLLTDVGRASEAHTLLSARRFQPWEGGEGQVLGAWDRAVLHLARAKLEVGAARDAAALVATALEPPANLGEARHPLANASELHLVAGDAYAAGGDTATAESHWRRAADAEGDFTKMATTPFSDKTMFSIIALQRLGEIERARAVTAGLERWVETYSTTDVGIDYFATSLPTMLLFIDDPKIDRDREVTVIRTQLAELSTSETSAATAP